MSNVLYISYTGLLEPLGQSQVLQYVRKLAEKHQMTVLSFEKPVLLRDQTKLAALKGELASANITWQYLRYHKRPSAPATLYDISNGLRTAEKLVRANKIGIVHARSYIPGVIGLLSKRRTGVRFVFDMRGFWPDERVDGGIWKRESMRYRIFKWIERHLFRKADHVVSLTYAGKREIEKFDYLQGQMPSISVIPTCTNLEIFAPSLTNSDGPKPFTLGYVGSAGSWYMFDKVAEVVRLLFDKEPDARFLVVNNGDHKYIASTLQNAGVELSRVEILSAPFVEVANHVARMDAGIFFIKPVWSKRASSPTRLGEFMACGKPVLANGNVGDVEQILKEAGAGVAINQFDRDTLSSALAQIIDLSQQNGIAQRCRDAAEETYSLDRGVAVYDEIYRRLDDTAQMTVADGHSS